MRKGFLTALLVIVCFSFAPFAIGSDIDLAKKSTLEEILSRGELRVGFEAGYLPFEMADKKGRFIGFDIDVAKEMAKAMGVKFVPVNTAWDGIISSLLTKKFDIIISDFRLPGINGLEFLVWSLPATSSGKQPIRSQTCRVTSSGRADGRSIYVTLEGRHAPLLRIDINGALPE